MDRIADAVIIAAKRESIRQTAAALDMPESTLRGWIQGSPELSEAFGYVEAPDMRGASAKAAIRALNKEVKVLGEALGTHQDRLDEMIVAARRPVSRPTFTRTRTASHFSKPERSVVLPIFDVQYGQHVRPQDTPFGKGGFSEAIFDERLERYLAKVCSYLKDRATSTSFTEMALIFGGDLNEGDHIFPGQVWQLEKNPIRQSLDLREKLGEAARRLIRFGKEELELDRIAVLGVPGNHGKVGGKQSGATPADYSWDFLTTSLIFDDLRDEPVDLFVNEAAGAILFETEGNLILITHGQEIKGAMGIPYYGLKNADGRYIRLSQRIHQYHLMGHIHQPANIPNGSGGATIVSGDWVGANNMSGMIIAGSRPQQSVLQFSRKYGLTDESRIYLDDHTLDQRAEVYALAR